MLGNSERCIPPATIMWFYISDNQNTRLVPENLPHFLCTEMPQFCDFDRRVVALRGAALFCSLNHSRYRGHAVSLTTLLLARSQRGSHVGRTFRISNANFLGPKRGQ